MISRRQVLAAALAATAAPGLAARAAEPSAAAGVISAYYDVLLATMKNGKTLGFNGRRDRLAPAIRTAFDLPQMTRLAVGPQWANVPAEQQQQLVDAFSTFSIATYANRFDGWSGEHFEVDPKPAPASNGAVIVHTKLVKTDGEPVTLDYLMRSGEHGWQIVDVYLSGTISELATRRSEFSSVIRRDGAAGLVDLLKKKAAQLAG